MRFVCLCLFIGCSSDAFVRLPTPPKQQAEERLIDVASYALDGRFDWEARELIAEVRIDFTAPMSGTVKLDSRVRVTAASVPYSQDDSTLTVTLTQPTPSITIAYKAKANAPTLNAMLPAAGDPVKVRSLYTHSEPLGVPVWMPCHNTPADRATFSISLTVPTQETVIANGALLSDTDNQDGTHTMRYQTDYTIPTYSMGFAAADFEIATVYKDQVPVSLIKRRGLTIDGGAFLERLVATMRHFERLAGPYPFHKYQVVLLPQITSVEHAEITFQMEPHTSAGASRQWLLTSHELGHAWFGNWVTIATFDDLWIKEGMGMVMGVEGLRANDDKTYQGALLSGDLYVSGAKMRDHELAPEDKYTTGPYGRAAWWFNQVRALVGERAFWGAFAKMRSERAQGTIRTSEVIDLFAAGLGDERTQWARNAIDASDLPVITGTRTSTGVQLRLSDPAHIMFAPLVFEWHTLRGISRTQTLITEVTLERASEDEFVVIDPQGIHPDLRTFFDPNSQDALETLHALAVPSSAYALLTAGGYAQLASVKYGMPGMTARDFNAIVWGLASERARDHLIIQMCRTGDSQWAPAVRDYITHRDPLLSSWANYGPCMAWASPVEVFAADMDAMRRGLATPEISLERMYWLSDQAYPLSAAADIWAPVAEKGYAQRVRDFGGHVAYVTLAANTLTETDKASWRSRALSWLLQGTAQKGALSIAGLTHTAIDHELANAIASTMHASVDEVVFGKGVCAARKVCAPDTSCLNTFTDAIADLTLPSWVTAGLEDAAACDGWESW